MINYTGKGGGDMGLTQCLQITFELWSAIFCLITAFCVYVTRQYDAAGSLYLLALLLTNAALNFTEAMAYYYRGNLTVTGYHMVRFSNFSVFLCNYLLLLFLLFYLCRVIERNGGNESPKLKNVAVVIIVAGIVLLALSRVFDFYYAFDESNRYYRLDTYWIMLLFTEAPLLILANFIFTNWQSLKNIEKNGFLMFIVLPVVGIVVQLFVYGVSVTTITDTIAIFTVFVSYELEYSDHMIAKERKMLSQTIRAFARTIDMRDRYTGSHSERVAKYSRMLAERMRLSDEKTRRIYQMALLHDVGKIGIDDSILRKASPLSPEEYETIKTHTAKGGEILRNITEMPGLAKVARWHHERYDGKGYPDGLGGVSIPLEVRIIGVADSYDAMTSNRSYRAYLPQDVVRAEIQRNAGTQFDPRVVRCMLEIMDEDTEYTLHE